MGDRDARADCTVLRRFQRCFGGESLLGDGNKRNLETDPAADLYLAPQFIANPVISEMVP